MAKTKAPKAEKMNVQPVKLDEYLDADISLADIKSNIGQSRGYGVLCYLQQAGYGLFEKASVDKEPIWEMLFAEEAATRANAVALIEQYEHSIVGLAESLEQHGQMEDVGMVGLEGGGYDVIFGMRRCIAAAYAWAKDQTKPDVISAKVFKHDLSPAQKLLLALGENEDREDESPMDRAFLFQKLQKQCGMSPADIGKRLKPALSGQMVTKYLKLLDPLLEPYRMKIHTRQLGIDPAMKLLDRKKNGDKAGESNGDGEHRARFPNPKKLADIYDDLKFPKTMSQEERELWQSDDVRKLLAYKLEKEFVSFDERQEQLEEIEKRKEARPKVFKISRNKAVKLLEALGKDNADSWSDELVASKLEDIPNVAGEEVVPEGPLSELLAKLLEAHPTGIKVEIK